MTAVFREVELVWQGRPYRFTPSNRLLRRIEGEGVALLGMIQAFQRGQPNVAQLAYVIAAVLQEAGGTVTEDEMLHHMIGQDQAEALRLAKAVMAAIFPQVGDPKKPAAPASARKTRGRQAS